jgi:CheY-like chemotaxis protein
VLLNLVGNAIKFTQRGRILVTTSCIGTGDGERVAFEVSDTGIGIEKTQHSRIFEPFVQALDPARPGHGGTGLGLAISRDLVRAMGGELEVESLPGEGTVFRFALPLRRAPGSAVAAPTSPPDAVAASPELQHARFLSGRVLLVEDNSVNRMVGTAMLESMGLTVVAAEDGEEALAVLSRTTVALVLMDCQMPVMDGYEATHRLREIERLTGAPRLPVIALTANALSGDVERCLAAGMDAHLAKPFLISQLRALIEHWLAAIPAGNAESR